MTLDKFLNFFLDKDVTKSLSQKYFRQIVARLTDVEQKKIREIACQIMLKTNDKQIIDNAIKIYTLARLGKERSTIMQVALKRDIQKIICCLKSSASFKNER